MLLIGSSSVAKSQSLSNLVRNPKDTICLNEEYARELVILARQKALVEADNVKLKEDNNAYFKGSGLLRIALEKSELETFHLKKAAAADSLAMEACETSNKEKDAQIVKEQKRTKRARTGTKITAFLGIAGIVATALLIK